MQRGQEDVSILLSAWARGDAGAMERLVGCVHGELLRVARLQLRKERLGHTLQASALVNEAWLRLMRIDSPGWSNRVHFFSIAAQQMRQILVDYARRKRRQKRGAGFSRVDLAEGCLVSRDRLQDVLLLDDALRKLEQFDPRKCRVVELRFFAGLSVEETAAALGVAPNTVIRDWAMARAWLKTHWAGTEEDGRE